MSQIKKAESVTMLTFMFVPALVLALILIIAENHNNYNKILSGERILVCFIDNEYKTIPPDMIEGKVDDVWLFKNGYARNCKVFGD